MKILLDTNFLIYCVYEKIDFLNEIDRICDSAYELLVPKQVLQELERLVQKEGNSKEGEKARTTLIILEQLIKEGKINVIEQEGINADKAIEKFVKENNEKVIVATMDKALKKKLKTRIIIIRQKSHLQLI